MFSKKTMAFLVMLMVLITGCATAPPQIPIGYDGDMLVKEDRIAVYVDELPDVKVGYPGANCLLCLATAATANSSFSGYAKKLEISEFDQLGSEITAALTSANKNAFLYSESIVLKNLKKRTFETDDDARKDHSPLQEKVGADHLLVIDIDYVGFLRDYANYIATSPPYVSFTGNAYLINLKTNKYLWYLPINQRNTAGLQWKEPPNYPALTNEFYKAAATVKEALLSGIKE